MRIVNRLIVLVYLLGTVLFVNGCATGLSSRETPTVRVVKQYAPAVVNIRTEQVMNLREHPAWGQYGAQIDQFLKQYFGED